MTGSSLLKNILAVAVGTLIACLMVASIDLVIPALMPDDPAQKRRTVIDMDYERYYSTDEFGLQLARAGRHLSRKTVVETGDTIYEVTYGVDENGRRITPLEDGESRSEHMLFAGGSFTWGEGVEDEETLPYQTAKLSPGFSPYIYAFHGWGPFDVLTKFRSYDLSKQIRQKQGIMVYGYIGAHVTRVAGSMPQMAWKWKAPYYELDEEGVLQRRGSFATGRPITTGIYRLLAHSKLLKARRVSLPAIGKEHYLLTARAITAIKQAYLEQFPDGQFFAMQMGNTPHARGITQALRALDIEALVVPTRFPSCKGEGLGCQLSTDDSHPTPDAYMEMASSLVSQLPPLITMPLQAP